MTGTVRPTKKQRELLDYIESFINEHGYSPSYREIMNGLQYNSVATVALHVGNLIKRGHLRKRDHSARSLEVVRQPDGQTGAPEEATHEDWLVRRVEAYIQQANEVSYEGRDFIADQQLLISALKILGLTEQAEALQQRLASQEAVVE
jgi:repressor LexA